MTPRGLLRCRFDAGNPFFRHFGGSPSGPATALSFRRNILERGGTAEAMEMYRNFRGREPSIEPLLEKRGLKEGNN